MARIALALILVLSLSAVLAACGPPPPTANFSWSLQSDFPVEVQFTDLSEGEIDAWEWDLDGDGAADSTEQNPVYTYRATGVYTVSLTVSGPGGNTTATGSITIIGSLPCKADFVAEPTSGEGVTEVAFTDQSTGDITEWAWDFDDDDSIDSTEQNPSHEYTRNGAYSVTLTVSGSDCNDTLTKTDYISITGCKA